MQIIKAVDRHYSDFGWLRTYRLFSFDTYFDPANTHFGKLRVFNDDIVAPNSGFPTHPHREMEIITIVHDGELTHRDSTGREGSMRAGEIQVMTAGRGITHSEHNCSDTPLHFHQIWLLPNRANLAPSYRQRSLVGLTRHNRMRCIASDCDTNEEVIRLNADAAIYLAELNTDTTIKHHLASNHGAFVYLTSGRITINDTELEPHDQARVTELPDLRIAAEESAGFVLIERVL